MADDGGDVKYCDYIEIIYLIRSDKNIIRFSK